MVVVASVIIIITICLAAVMRTIDDGRGASLIQSRSMNFCHSIYLSLSAHSIWIHLFIASASILMIYFIGILVCGVYAR